MQAYQRVLTQRGRELIGKIASQNELGRARTPNLMKNKLNHFSSFAASAVKWVEK
jgi:hypothetical protein